ncbi:Glutathione peroxidase [Spraguea lophii 42_110]|uniref:Glutathione peroxidase n=1 Tax=Spraguea lophii (strain 42_110) TaxID=1358809 RepID=S7WBB9_SPRLO|nr:Glutathione peroxidase [Spraguea lophii 42_110]
MSFYSLSAINADGEKIDFSQFKNQCCLIVNVASKCGLSSKTYKSLVSLSNVYPSLNILLFPCNQFLEQEPGEMCEIKKFVWNYSKSFNIFDKVDVNGENRHPVYRFLVSQKSGWWSDNIKWNFTKFLVNKKGEVVKRYGPLEKVCKDDEYLIKSLTE